MRNIIMKEFEDYLDGQFQTDLRAWFDLDNKVGFRFDPYAAMFATKEVRPQSCSSTPLSCDFFRTAIYYATLAPQAIAKVTESMDAMYAFCRCSGWPVLCVIMGGPIAPAAELEKADLMPEDRSTLCVLIRETLPVIEKKVMDTLSCVSADRRTKAFRELGFLTEGRLPQIVEAIRMEAEAFGTPSESKVYYIPDCIRQQ